jgi:predicted RNase H-like nuclease (RuvC/YqgF family)
MNRLRLSIYINTLWVQDGNVLICFEGSTIDYVEPDDEDYSDDDALHSAQDSPTNVAHMVLKKRRAMKRASTDQRHERRIQELEQEVERLSGQVQRLQETNDGLRLHVASLDSNLNHARKTIPILSSRAVYIVRRFHEVCKEKLEQNQDDA